MNFHSSEKRPFLLLGVGQPTAFRRAVARRELDLDGVLRSPARGCHSVCRERPCCLLQSMMGEGLTTGSCEATRARTSRPPRFAPNAQTWSCPNPSYVPTGPRAGKISEVCPHNPTRMESAISLSAKPNFCAIMVGRKAIGGSPCSVQRRSSDLPLEEDAVTLRIRWLLESGVWLLSTMIPVLFPRKTLAWDRDLALGCGPARAETWK